MELIPDETVDNVPPYAPTTKSEAAPGFLLKFTNEPCFDRAGCIPESIKSKVGYQLVPGAYPSSVQRITALIVSIGRQTSQPGHDQNCGDAQITQID